VGRVWHVRWLLPLVAVVGLVAVWRGAQAPRWRALAPGVEFGSMSGAPYCRLGSSSVALLRLDPARARMRVRHFSRLPADEPPSIVEWQQRTGAIAVFNAGQFYPDWSYMGLLIERGDTVSARLHPGFQAALVARSSAPPRRAAVLDLARDPLPGNGGWDEVAQSFMLFDRASGLRVRRSSHVANRTAVAQDARGHLVVVVSEGGYTLAEFGEMLMDAPLGLTHAMAMDGGQESELVVAAGAFRYASFGPWPRNEAASAPGARVRLPAVVTVEGK